MPRTKRNSAIPVFNFQQNPTKTLAAATMKIYKARLNQLSELSYLRHQENPQSPIVTSKDDILKNPELVVAMIEGYSADKKKRAAFFASVFYSTGRIDLEKMPSAKPLVTGFQKNYYSAEAFAERQTAENQPSDSSVSE